MAAMALWHLKALPSTARPWRTGVLASATAAGGVAIAGAGLLFPDPPAQAVTNVATSTLINLTVYGVPALNLSAFQGTYATSDVTQNAGDDAADPAQDPDGVLKHITISGSAQSKTHSDPAKNSAQSQLESAEYSLHGKQIYTVGSVDTDAECSSSVHATAVKVLDTTVPAGKTTTVPVTGSQIGVPSVDHGSLKVTYSTAATSATGTTPAHAHLDLSFTGTFFDAAGKQLYSGPVQKVRFGDVQATCADSSSPSSTPPTPTTPAPPTSATTPGGSGSPSAAGSPVGTNGANGAAALPGAPAALPESEAGESGHHAHRASRAHKGGSTERSAVANGPMLPVAKTGAEQSSGDGPSPWWIVLSVLGLSGGAVLYFATRRRGTHQQ